MRRLLHGRRAFAVGLVALVLVSAVIGSLRDEGGDPGDGAPDARIQVSPDPSGSASASPDTTEVTGPAFPTAVAPTRPVVDEASGLPVVQLESLPAEAVGTVELIDDGGPFPYADDGETFLNSAGLLPARETGYYRVYTVDTPGTTRPTDRRIVTGSDGELYWTDDRYRSFRRVYR